MAREPKVMRTVRVDERTWTAAMAAADERGEVLSEEIRGFLVKYAAGTARRPRRAPKAVGQ